MYSFAAITDDPTPEVSATGHQRTVITLQKRYLSEWPSPAQASRDRLNEILLDRQAPISPIKSPRRRFCGIPLLAAEFQNAIDTSLPLTSPEDLFAKLRRDAALLLDEEVTTDRFFNFLITGYSLSTG